MSARTPISLRLLRPEAVDAAIRAAGVSRSRWINDAITERILRTEGERFEAEQERLRREHPDWYDTAPTVVIYGEPDPDAIRLALTRRFIRMGASS